MHRTRVGLTAFAGATYALVLWGHAALADAGRFALLLACVTLAWLAVAARSGRIAGARRGEGRAWASVDGTGIGAERDELRRLEAELHALEDQLASAPDPFAAPSAGPSAAAGVTEPVRG